MIIHDDKMKRNKKNMNSIKQKKNSSVFILELFETFHGEVCDSVYVVDRWRLRISYLSLSSRVIIGIDLGN